MRRRFNTTGCCNPKIALKKAFDAKEHGAVSAGLDESIEFYQNKIADLANGQGNFKFNFSTPSATNSASKAGSSAGDAYLKVLIGIGKEKHSELNYEEMIHILD